MMIQIEPDFLVTRLRVRHPNVRLRVAAPKAPRTRRTPARRAGLSMEKQAEFLSALTRAGTLAEALRLSGVDRTSVLEQRARDALFSRAWDEAQDQRVAEIEAMLVDKALAGLSQTDVMATDKAAEAAIRYSTNLGMWLLEARMPHRYAKGAARNAAGPTAEAKVVPARDPAADAARVAELLMQAEKRLRASEEAMPRIDMPGNPAGAS